MSLNIEHLERSFAEVKDHGSEFTATFYATLFSKHPEVRSLFQHTQMKEQGEKLFQSLVLVVESLRNPDVLNRSLKGLGTRHVNYGVLPQHYPMVGNALLKTFELFLGTNWTPEVQRSWFEAYQAVAQIMLEGANYPPEILDLTEAEQQA
ncbi:flavohemoprotein [filamentous cyanobacterium CCP1]|nr:flavohemoprotein [filamentous cyanobacterium CCP2]PSB58755.1 flavohemoprotein [filamentous cyanobacterium CCP1]